MKVLFSGGATMGSVSPLIAIYEELKVRQPGSEFLWLATKYGPEKKVIAEQGINVKQIYSGKLRRYFSISNLLSPLLVALGFIQAFFAILKFKPQIIITAGGFVAVPVVWAGWILRVPSVAHQQDVVPGLANKLMAPLAKVITVTFEKSLNDFPAEKTVVAGNPVRQDILRGDKSQALNFFNLKSDLPVVLILGGGTGARAVNDLVFKSLESLVQFCQVLHISGGKTEKIAEHNNYRHFDFLTSEMPLAYAAADIVVSRAGMSSLTEIANLKKPSIIIPMPDTHQEVNAVEFFKKNAVMFMDEKKLTAENFSAGIKNLLEDKNEQQNLIRNLAKVMPEASVDKILKTFI